jgi:streptomycin 3"-adenylyltransferase
VTPSGVSDPVTAQADAVLAALDRALSGAMLVGASLYGSAVSSGLRPDSDLDLFGVLSRRLTDGEKRVLVDGLVPLSWRCLRPATWRPVELTLVVQSEVRPWRYPPHFEFQYGEWLRGELVSGNLAPWPPVNPDVAVLLTMVLGSGRPLLGPPAADLLDPVPHDDLVRAMRDEVPSLLDDLDSDTRNVLLTLARIWTTVATGGIRSKHAAADWVLARLPEAHRPVLELARDAYLGVAEDRSYDRGAVKVVVDAIFRQLGPSAALPPTDASV